jgi:predicted nucleic acid-binding protein
MIGVVDTSALIRLFIPDGPMPDGFEGFLRGVERGLNSAIAPELLMAESANVLAKKLKSGELTATEGDQLHAIIMELPIRYFTHRFLLPRAFELASDINLTVYDTLYLALSEDRGAVLYTADLKLQKMAAELGLL